VGGKSSTSTSQVSIPPQVLAQYNTVTSQANALMGTNPATGQPNTPFQFYSTNPNAFVAPLDPTQQAGIAGTNYYANAAQPYYQGATDLTLAGAGPANLGALQTNRYMSPFLSDVYGTQLAGEQMLNQQQASGLQGQAIQAGAFGGDRSGVAAANLAYQQNLANNQTNAGLLQAGYTQAQNTAAQQQAAQLAAQQANLARLTSAGAQLGGLGTAAQTAGLQGAQAQQAAGLTQQQTAQAGLQALYNQFLQAQAYPFQTLGELANISEGIGALSGSTTTSTQPSSFFSDERLKEDIQPIGETYDGQKIVKFKYKGKPGKQIGLIAQDVEKHHPDAVGLMGGYKTVDYDRATDEAAHRGHFYSGGLVPSSEGGAVGIEHAGEGFADGGMPGVAAQQLNLYSNLGLIPGKGNPYMPSTGSGGLGGMGGGQPRQLMVAHEPTQHQPTMMDAAQSMSNWANLGEKGDAALFGKTGEGGLVGGTKSALYGSPAQYDASGKMTSDVSRGLIGVGGQKGGGYLNTSSAASDPSSSPEGGGYSSNNPPPVPDTSYGGLSSPEYRGGRIHEAHGGLVPRHPYAAGGISTPYENTGDDSKGYMGEAQDAQPAPPKQLQTASTPSQGPSGAQQLGSLAGGIGGLASGVGMAASGLSKLLPLLAARNGGFIHEPYHDDAPHHHGGGEGLMGFGALAARRRAAGGLVGRKGYGPGGAPDDTQDGAQDVSPSGLSLSDILNAGEYERKRNDQADQAPQVGLAAATSPVTPPAAPPQGGVVGPSGTVTQQTPEGPGAFDKGGWMERNQSWLVPLLSGIGGMASSNSRYLGSALLQGLGAGAQAYEGVQGQMAQRAQTEAQTTAIPQRMAIETRAQDLNLLQSLIARRAQFAMSGQIPPELDMQINALSQRLSVPGVPPFTMPTGAQPPGQQQGLGGHNPGSTASGPAQFLDQTWLSTMRQNPAYTNMSDSELLKLKDDYGANKVATENYARSNIPALQRAGVPVNDNTLRIAHGFGPGDAPRVLQNPTAPMETLFPPGPNGEPNRVLAANPSYRGKTAGQVTAMLLGQNGNSPNLGPDTGKFSNNYSDFVINRESGSSPRTGSSNVASPTGSAVAPPVADSGEIAALTPNGGANIPNAASNYAITNNPENAKFVKEQIASANIPDQANPFFLTQKGNTLAAQGLGNEAVKQWQSAREQFENIANRGIYLGNDGVVQQVPGWMDFQLNKARTAGQIDFANQQAAAANARFRNKNLADDVRKILETSQTGALMEPKAQFAKLASAMTGRPTEIGEAYDILSKDAQQSIGTQLQAVPGHATDSARTSVAQSTFNPKAEPRANAHILAQMYALNDIGNMYLKDAVDNMTAANAKGQTFDQAAFNSQWNAIHADTYGKLMDKYEKDIAVKGGTPATADQMRVGQNYIINGSSVKPGEKKDMVARFDGFDRNNKPLITPLRFAGE